MALEALITPLPCGRDPLTVADQARAGQLDAHCTTCPYCQAVIEEDLQLLSARDITSEPVTPPATLLPAIMATVWSELRPGRNLPLPAARGLAFASERAVTSLLQHTLDELPDLLVHRCRLHLDPPEVEEIAATNADADAGVAEPSLRIEISAAAAYLAELAVLAEQVRTVTTATLVSQFGLAAQQVDVEFVDLFPDPRQKA